MVKNYEKLTLSNDFVFGKVMENPDLCKKVLETLLQTKIDLQKLCDDEGWWAVYMKSVTWEMDARYEGIEIGREEGTFKILVSLVEDGIIGIPEAAKRANVSEEEFKLKMKEK